MQRKIKNQPKGKVAKQVPVAQYPLKGLPSSMLAKVRFADFYGFTSAAGYQTQTFRLNSIYDPDVTGVGGQPSFYNTLAGLYESYIVEKATVSLFIIQNDAQESEQLGLVPHVPGESIIAGMTASQQIPTEMPGCKWIILPPAVSGATRPTGTLTASYDLRALKGGPLDPSSDGSMFGSNPTAAYYLDVVCCHPSSVVSALSSQYQIVIEYDVRCTGFRRDNYLD